MKKICFPFLLLIIISISFIVNAQTTSTYEQVYNIFQQKCAACHNSASFSGQMDLSGSPATVYSNIVNKVPANPIAAGKGYKRIEPGNPHRSFILKKINNGLDSDVSLGGGEGAAMPQSPNAPLNNYEIELIRQWVMMGAPQTGIVVDTALINTYYNIGGINATPAPLPPPAPADGFQIHIGKVFLNKGEEKEVFLKYNPKLADDIEINRIQFFTASNSHHFVIYKYYSGQSLPFKEGWRDTSESSHGSADIVSPFLNSNVDLLLPQNTAYRWFKTDVLDLNLHAVNYSQDSVVAFDVYMNIYTQPSGTADKLMFSRFFPNLGIIIPQDGQQHTFTEEAYDSTMSNMWDIWVIYTHTHKYGLDYDAYLRNPDGTKGTQIYEGWYNYDIGANVGYYATGVEAPQRYFQPFLTVDPRDGFIHEAVFKNYAGPDTVYFGLTSFDEMMVFGFQYTVGADVSVNNLYSESKNINVYPNPFTDRFIINAQENIINTRLKLFDILGKEIMVESVKTENKIIVNRGNLPAGIYFIKLLDSNGNTLLAGKITAM